jgi:hypothetical protein
MFQNAEEWTAALDGSENFLKACYESGIQLVLFGHNHHQHYQTWKPKDSNEPEAKNEPETDENEFGDARQPLHLFCCPSTLEINATPNGFYTFDIHDKARITWQLYSKNFHEAKDLEPFLPDPQKRGEINFVKKTEPVGDQAKPDAPAALRIPPKALGPGIGRSIIQTGPRPRDPVEG